MNFIIILCFWGSLLLLAYTAFGYPALLRLLAARRRTPEPTLPANDMTIPAVSIVIVAHNEATRIRERVINLRQSNWNAALPEIIIVNDGSKDDTAAVVKKIDDPFLRLIEMPQRVGKAAGLNLAISAATGEIIIFADARQQFKPDTLSRLVAHFNDPFVGAVSGALELASADNPAGDALTLYWQYEKNVRFLESRLDSAIGCTGAVYAARRRLLPSDLPPDTLLDDVVIPMHIASAGYRVLFDPAARAFDPMVSDAGTERRRKGRTLAGNLQMLTRYPAWLLPWRNRLWWQLLSHKYLRLAVPPALGLMLAGAIARMPHPVYAMALIIQLFFYALAVIGLCRPNLRNRWLRLPAGVLFLGLMPLAGLWNYLARRHRSGW